MSDKIPQIALNLLEKIFVRYPKDRITIEKLKNHEFFWGIDFENLHTQIPPL